MKECTSCKVVKPYEEFHNSSLYKDGRGYRCKECDNRAAALYYNSHKEKTLNRTRKQKYGIDNNAVYKLLQEQDGKCAICLNEFTGDGKNRQVIDHCHTTNQVRGLLCARCNQALGLFRDNKHILYSAIEYLEH